MSLSPVLFICVHHAKAFSKRNSAGAVREGGVAVPHLPVRARSRHLSQGQAPCSRLRWPYGKWNITVKKKNIQTV